MSGVIAGDALTCGVTLRQRNVTTEGETMPKPRAIGYVRVSTIEQVNGFGLDVQETAIRSYAKEHGYRLVDVARDEGLSGSNGLDTRKGLADALAALERGEAEALIVYRLDRLARDLIVQETTIARLQEAGVTLLSVTEPDIDSEDATRVLVRQVLGAIGQYERALIRSRMAAGRAAKAAKGGYAGGRPKFGYRAVAGELQPEPTEQAVIGFARKLRAEGKSIRQIAAALTEEGHKPKAGHVWHPPQVARLLANR